MLMERSQEYNEDVYFCFIDYSKAFDCVNHAVLWNRLREMGFPMHLITLIEDFYKEQEATVRIEVGECENPNWQRCKTRVHTITDFIQSLCRSNHEKCSY